MYFPIFLFEKISDEILEKFDKRFLETKNFENLRLIVSGLSQPPTAGRVNGRYTIAGKQGPRN